MKIDGNRVDVYVNSTTLLVHSAMLAFIIFLQVVILVNLPAKTYWLRRIMTEIDAPVNDNVSKSKSDGIEYKSNYPGDQNYKDSSDNSENESEGRIVNDSQPSNSQVVVVRKRNNEVVNPNVQGIDPNVKEKQVPVPVQIDQNIVESDPIS